MADSNYVSATSNLPAMAGGVYVMLICGNRRALIARGGRCCGMVPQGIGACRGRFYSDEAKFRSFVTSTPR